MLILKLRYCKLSFKDIIKLERIPNKSVDAGDSARFTCGLRRGKDVTFSWTKNGNVLTDNARIRISFDADLSVLTIRNTSVEDAGNYTCVAKNLFSESRETTGLFVEGKSFTRRKIKYKHVLLCF